MSQVIAVLACGFTLAACSMSMPSLDFFKPSPDTEVLRVESEPPGADARTTQGQNCRTPCELAVPAGGEFAISFALNGYQPQTVQVRAEPSAGETASAARLQPNPVYAELQPMKPPVKKKSIPRKSAQKTAPARGAADAPAMASTPAPAASASFPNTYPWPDPQSR